MKDAELAKLKEKSNFRFFLFLYFELWSFLYSNHSNFRWIFTITQKIKIEKLIFHSIQHIPHLSYKSDYFWGGRGLHVLTWDRVNRFLCVHTSLSALFQCKELKLCRFGTLKIGLRRITLTQCVRNLFTLAMSEPKMLVSTSLSQTVACMI